MSAADIPIASELTLLRTQWESDLRAVEQDVKSFAQRMEAIPINIPVKARDDITAQVQQIRMELQSQPIVIPVVADTGGMSGGFGGGGGGAATPGGGLGEVPTGVIPGADAETGGGGGRGLSGFGGFRSMFLARRLASEAMIGVRGFMQLSDAARAEDDAARILRNAHTHEERIEGLQERAQSIRERQSAFGGAYGMAAQLNAWIVRQSEQNTTIGAITGAGMLGAIQRARGIQSTDYDLKEARDLTEAEIKSERHTERQEREAEAERRRRDNAVNREARGLFDFSERLTSRAEGFQEMNAGEGNATGRQLARVNQNLRDELRHIDEHAAALRALEDGTGRARDAAQGLSRMGREAAYGLARTETESIRRTEAAHDVVQASHAAQVVSGMTGQLEQMQLHALGFSQEAQRTALRRSIDTRYNALADQMKAASILGDTDAWQNAVRERDALARTSEPMQDALRRLQDRQNEQATEAARGQAAATEYQARGMGRSAFYAEANARLGIDLDAAAENPALQRQIMRGYEARANLFERVRSQRISSLFGEAQEQRIANAGRGGEAAALALNRQMHEELAEHADDPEARRAIGEKYEARADALIRGQRVGPTSARELYDIIGQANVGGRTREAAEGARQNARQAQNDADRAVRKEAQHDARAPDAERAGAVSERFDRSTEKFDGSVDKFVGSVKDWSDQVVG